jgi:lysozyme family protein
MKPSKKVLRQRRYYARNRARLVREATARTQRARKLKREQYLAYARKGYRKHRASNLARTKAWKRKNRERQRAINRKSANKAVVTMTVSYLRATLAPKKGQHFPSELIELQRVKLTLKRILYKAQ